VRISLFEIIIISVLALLVVGFISNANERDRLITQCLNDGRKEYECKSMYRENSSTMVPVFIHR